MNIRLYSEKDKLIVLMLTIVNCHHRYEEFTGFHNLMNKISFKSIS